MGVYNNNKDGTRSTLANTIQVVDAPMEQFVSRGEFNAIVPSDTSADNKLVNDDTVNDIWKVQGELGAKNLIPYPYKNFGNSTTLGVTFVINNDGSITLNGTATANIYKLLLTRDFGNQPFSSIYNNPNVPYLITLLNGTNDVHCNYNPNDHYTTLVVEKGATIDNLTVYPMIRYKIDTDDTWQPYAPTNYQLNQKVDTIAGVYLPNATNTGTKKVVASVGQTSVTFDTNSFMTRYNVTASDLDLDISAETTSGDVVAYNNVSVTGGIVTVTFDALAEQTTFICKCSVIQ
jgi:hypothetical protein